MPHLVSSDLQRTRQTAERIGGVLRVAPALDAGVREKSYGIAEGRPKRWLDERIVRTPAIGSTFDHDEGIAGAETRREWIERVFAAVARFDLTPAEHRIVVTHGGTVSWVIAARMGLPIEACDRLAFRVPSGSVSILKLDDRYRTRALVRLGDRSFIDLVLMIRLRRLGGASAGRAAGSEHLLFQGDRSARLPE